MFGVSFESRPHNDFTPSCSIIALARNNVVQKVFYCLHRENTHPDVFVLFYLDPSFLHICTLILPED